MNIALPTEQVQTDFEQSVLQAWHEAHGAASGHASSSWGEDRVVVMIEDALFKAERLLTQHKQGREVLEAYMYELLTYIVNDQAEHLAQLLRREIISTSISVNATERWLLFVFRLAD